MLGTDNIIDDRLQDQDRGRESKGAPNWIGTALEGTNGGVGINISEYWRLVLKHRFLIAVLLCAALVIGVVITLLSVPVYSASSTLQIDREAARILDVGDASPREPMIQGEEFFQTQYGLIRSRSLAERVMQGEGLASSDAFLETMNVKLPAGEPSDGTRANQRRELVIRTIQKNLGVTPVRGSRLVTVSFSSPDAQLSARMANAFAENFIQANLDRKFESSKYARTFLEERITQTKAKLEDAERQLVAYATAQQIINVHDSSADPGESQSLASSNLVAINDALAQATANRVLAEERWRQARTSTLLSLPEVYQNPAIQQLTQERAKRDAEYQNNLAVYQPDFPSMVQARAEIAEFDRQINTVAGGIRSSIQHQYTVSANTERSLQARVDGLKASVLDLRDRSIRYNILQREVDTSRTLYDGLLQRYKEVGVTGGVTTNNISIVDNAVPPNKPSSPKLIVNLLISMVIGLGLGVVATFLLEALDETLATPEDVEAKLGMSVLGTAPKLAKGDTSGEALNDARSPLSEAYQSLRTALQFSTADGAPRTILITSSRPGEGKSTTAYSLATNFARIGKRVLLIDGDLRNPSMHRLIGVDNGVGMSNVLSGSADLDAVRVATSTPNLSFIPCGPLPPNPAELWASNRLRDFLNAAGQQYDHIIIDGPPVLGFADSPTLGAVVEGTLFVLESRGTRRGQARGALRRLALGRARLLGIVLTKFDTKAASYGSYEYAYDYHYGVDASRKRK